MQHNIGARVATIVAVLLIGLAGIFPPGKLFNSDLPWHRRHNLKPGIDISGGTSLLYEIKVENAIDAANIATRVAETLKKRVDPDGVRNLVWRPQGNRLEIQMPLSADSEKADDARKAFTAAQDVLQATNVRMSEVNAALQMADKDARAKRLQDLSRGSAQRLGWLNEMAALTDQLKAFAPTTQKSVEELEAQYDANKRLKDLTAQVDATNLGVAQVQSILDLSHSAIEKARRERNDALVQQRQQELDGKIAALKAQTPGFDRRLAAIDSFVKAYAEYAHLRDSVDDAEDLKRLLRGSGVLEFHILVTDFQDAEAQSMIQRLPQKGPAPQPTDTMRWYEVDRPDQLHGARMEDFADKKWVLAYTTADKSMVHREGAKAWGLQRAYKSWTGSGAAVVGFDFDAQGAQLFGDLTGNNIDRPLAIALDDKVISAPNIRSQISASGIIEGNYTDQDLTYLVGTLNAGSLPARLADEPIMERTVGPQLGADNLKAGFIACIIGLIVVAVFLIGYYYLAGVIATIAVMMNMVMILGVMAMFNATLTLPGIAGIVLTVGMAVDANVLIFERLREEQLRGLSLRMALRNAYDRAFSAILDSNVTTAITSVILYYFGSEEVKGFGLTLLIGILSSLFTALFVTRTLFTILIEKFQVRQLGSLPLTFPNWDRMLKPNIDWMSKAWIFYVFSTVFIVAGLSAFFIKGRQMFDIEFVNGTAVQVELKPGKEMTREQVQALVSQARLRNVLPAAQAVAVGRSNRDYEIVTPNNNAPQVRDAIMTALGENLKVDPPSRFERWDAGFDDAMGSTVVPVKPGEPLVVDGFAPSGQQQHVGGVAVVLRNLDPLISVSEVKARLQRARLQQDIPYREISVESVTSPEQPASLIVVLASDPALGYDRDPDVWREQLARPMWKLVAEAVSKPPALQKVINFSPQVASDTMRDAIIALTLSIIAIMMYIWVRFGDAKYGTATVVALLHDTLITIGAIGVSHYIANTVVGDSLLIEPFRMNLTLVAAILTVMGYSMNDTIVVFDRIRENRGKYGYANRQIINDSINQTLSRTLLTGGTTIITVFVMYIWGGPGVHGFTFALLVGILVGTYSSIAIASPILLLGKEKQAGTSRRLPSGQLQKT